MVPNCSAPYVGRYQYLIYAHIVEKASTVQKKVPFGACQHDATVPWIGSPEVYNHNTYILSPHYATFNLYGHYLLLHVHIHTFAGSHRATVPIIVELPTAHKSPTHLPLDAANRAPRQGTSHRPGGLHRPARGRGEQSDAAVPGSSTPVPSSPLPRR